MSISSIQNSIQSSIQSFPPARSAPAQNQNAGSGSSAETGPGSVGAEGTAQAVSETVSGTLPKQETPVAKNAAPAYELPEDVVEVHQDPETRDRVIIEYLDPSK